MTAAATAQPRGAGASTSPTPFACPRLLVDIGGTHARFALEPAAGRFTHLASLRCDEHADFHAVVRAYLDTLPAGVRVEHAAVATPNPVEGDQVRMTNYPWAFSIERTRQQLGLDALVVVNDFTALAMALPRLGNTGVRQVGGGHARPQSPTGLLGSGSGLGVSALIPAGDGWVSLGSEGGHASFSPRDERELTVLRHAWTLYEHVSFERLLSGPGLVLTWRALAVRAGLSDVAAPTAIEITRRALQGGDALAAETVEVFCNMLGTAAANLAVTLGASGGIYIGGAIVPRLGEAFDRSGFRARFESKGRFSRYVAAIPTFVITAPEATFIGASAILDSQLRALHSTASVGILGQIRRASAALSPAELRVAECVLAQPRTVLNQPIADIARAAGVSQPTVIRFCRSLGCQGLADFKLRLASGLTGTLPITHVQVTNDDSTAELGAKVLGNTASAILHMRGQLNRDMIERSIELLAGARRVEFCALGSYAAVAVDAQYKFLRFGVAAGACTEARMQLLSVGVLGPGDVVVLISLSGRLPELLQVADRAHERGAAVIALTASGSPLARKADAVIAVDRIEDATTQVPMIGRILKLLVVDILVVGVAMRRQGTVHADATRAEGLPAADGEAAPTLAHLTPQGG